MNYNKDQLPTRLELAQLVKAFFDTLAEAKKSKDRNDWANHYRSKRELIDTANSIIYLTNDYNEKDKNQVQDRVML